MQQHNFSKLREDLKTRWEQRILSKALSCKLGALNAPSEQFQGASATFKKIHRVWRQVRNACRRRGRICWDLPLRREKCLVGVLPTRAIYATNFEAKWLTAGVLWGKMANCTRTRFASRGKQANVMQKYGGWWFIFVKQNRTMHRTNKYSISFGHTVWNDTCSRQAHRRQVRLEYEARASLGQVNKWGVAKHLQNLPSVLRRKSSYQQEIPVTSLRALSAMKRSAEI